MLMRADERAALEMWLDRSNTSPVTRQQLALGFRRNLVLRQLIQDWEQARACPCHLLKQCASRIAEAPSVLQFPVVTCVSRLQSRAYNYWVD